MGWWLAGWLAGRLAGCDGHEPDRWLDHAAGEGATQPEGRIALDSRRNPLHEVLSFPHRRVLTLVEVRASPMPV